MKVITLGLFGPGLFGAAWTITRTTQLTSYTPCVVLLLRRYDVTGALQYLKLSSYRVALSYREAPSTAADVQQLCTVACEVCRMAGGRRVVLVHVSQVWVGEKICSSKCRGGGWGAGLGVAVAKGCRRVILWQDLLGGYHMHCNTRHARATTQCATGCRLCLA